MKRAAAVLILALVAALCPRADAALHPRNLRCEYRANPVGIDLPSPRLSWELASTENLALDLSFGSEPPIVLTEHG